MEVGGYKLPLSGADQKKVKLGDKQIAIDIIKAMGLTGSGLKKSRDVEEIKKHIKLTGVDYYEKEDLETMKRLLEGQDWKKIDAALKNLKKNFKTTKARNVKSLEAFREKKLQKIDEDTTLSAEEKA